MSERLARLKDRHRGGRCVIVANGPSLNGMDLSFLRREITIGLNKIHLGLSRFHFHPRYYVAVNPKVVQQSLAPIRALNCVKLVSTRAAEAAGLQEDALTYLVRTDNPPARFSTDLTQGLHEGWTVTHAALQLAYHLGFDDVVLIGLDHRYAFDGQPNESRVMDGDDPNHFSGAYFGHGQNWDNPDLAESEQSYRAALEAYRQSGRSLRDATVQGACTVFPKADYRRVFSVA
jgi:Protein of unknown function DUF115